MDFEELKKEILESLIPLIESNLLGGRLKSSFDDHDEAGENPYFRTTGNDYTAKRNKMLLDFMNNLDINDVPISIREHLKSLDIVKIYDKYNKYNDDYLFENRTTNKYPLLKYRLKIDREHYILSASEVVEDLKERYGCTDNEFYTTAPNKAEIVNINLAYEFDCMSFANISHIKFRDIKEHRLKSLEVIDKECADRGYFRAATQIVTDENCEFYIKCIYNPVRDIPIKEMVLSRRLMHCSYTDNHDSIMEYGLLPKNNGDRIFDYPSERLFFYVQGPLIEKNAKFAEMMHGVVQPRKEKGQNTEMCVYEVIHPRRLPKYIEFFYDPNHKDCIYCTKTVSSKFLEVVMLADFSTSPAYFEDVVEDI